MDINLHEYRLTWKGLRLLITLELIRKVGKTVVWLTSHTGLSKVDTDKLYCGVSESLVCGWI